MDVTVVHIMDSLMERQLDKPAAKMSIFRGKDDNVFAIKDECPHKKGPLSQGIMHGDSVTCPLHNWKISLVSGEALGVDEGCTNTYETKVEDGKVYLILK